MSVASALALAPIAAEAQELTSVFCNDTPLDFRWIVKWAPPVGAAPVGSVEILAGGAGCTDEWRLFLHRGNFRAERVGAALFDELVFSARHLVSPSTPDHSEPANETRLVFHVDGGILGQLDPAVDETAVPGAALAKFDPAMLTSPTFTDPPASSIPHPNKGHRDKATLRYQTVAGGINFIFEGNHVVPEPATLALVGVGLTCLGGAAVARRRRA